MTNGVSRATHYLRCRHCIGKAVHDYRMPCLILKKMPDGRVKVLVFGDRYWADREHIERVRYVDRQRLTPISAFESDPRRTASPLR